MSNLNPIRYVGGLVLLGLASCSTSQLATQGETDNLYFMASDARVATEFAVKNNTPENFRNMGEAQSIDIDTESFSNRNVNPEYIARYQRPSQPVEEGSVYFDDSNTQAATRQGNGNIDAYDNFRGGSGNVTNNFFMNPMMGMGMGFNPMMGFGRFPMMGGFYDPFWGPGMGMGFYDPFWGPGMGMGMMGFRPGFSMGFGMGFGSPFMRTGFGFGNPWMMGGGLGFGNPWMMGGGLGFYDPWMMRGGFFRPGFYNPIIIMPGGEGGRQVVRSARPNMGSSLATSDPRSRSAATQPGSSRSAARRDAIGSSPTGRQNTAASSRNNFSRSQNDYYSNPRASAAPARRNVSSPAVSRPSTATGTRSGYAAPARVGTSPRAVSAPEMNNRTINSGTNRSGYAAPSRNTSPSYNRSTRSTSPAYNNSRSTSPSINNQRSTAPSRSNTFSAPSRSSSPSFSAPSGGGGSRGGGGGSVGGGRRGN
jgi:hypothetical protein